MKKDCAVYNVANFIGKRWTILIFLELYKGNLEWKRYSELKRRLSNITPKILSMRLKELISEGIVEKRVDSDVLPIQSKYRLTKKGKEFIKVILAMKEWSLKNMNVDKVCGSRDCKYCSL